MVVQRNCDRLTQMSKDSLGSGMVQVGHPTVPLDPTHSGCSEYPEDGMEVPGGGSLAANVAL